MSDRYPGGWKAPEPTSKALDHKTRKRLAQALDERAARVASEGGFGWARAAEALQEAAEDLRDGKL